MWKCSNCRFVVEGDAPPEVCPRCGAPRDAFEQVPAETAELARRSKLSNTLHQRLAAVLDEAERIAQAGVEDNLDPGCVKIFKETLAFADEMKRKIAAEIAVHVGKGKWGV
ncbi:MAG: rubredoxin [Armatimonadetes bacterium]|nr:rubredoxin [Armatimonadota bacterium]